MLMELRKQVCRANRDLARYGLVTLTWGNVSGICREKGLIAIKPSGVSYSDLTPSDLVIVNLDGKPIEGKLRPSTDAPTHLALYRAFPWIGGVAHTHSPYATMFSQACRGIPCLGTTHADHFPGEVPVTRRLTRREVCSRYEANTGKVIAQRISRLKTKEMPAVLVAGHGPFTWGKDASEAVENSIVLEEVARIAWGTLCLSKSPAPIHEYLMNRHYTRKHGSHACYGQKDSR